MHSNTICNIFKINTANIRINLIFYIQNIFSECFISNVLRNLVDTKQSSHHVLQQFSCAALNNVISMYNFCSIENKFFLSYVHHLRDFLFINFLQAKNKTSFQSKINHYLYSIVVICDIINVTLYVHLCLKTPYEFVINSKYFEHVFICVYNNPGLKIIRITFFIRMHIFSYHLGEGVQIKLHEALFQNNFF